MTDHDPLAPIEALADDWAAKQRRNRERFVDGPIPMPKSPHLPPPETFEPVSELRDALTEAREAVDALVAERHDDRCESEYETGAHAWTPCGCWASRSEAEGLLRRAEAAEAERDRLREALGRVEAVVRGSQPTHEAAVTEGYMLCQGDVLDALGGATGEEAGQ